MHKLFVPYQLALKLKALQFNEPCLAYYEKKVLKEFRPYYLEAQILNSDFSSRIEGFHLSSCSAPLFTHAFKWFRDKYDLHQSIIKYSGSKTYWCQIEMISDKKNKRGEYDVIYATNLSTFTKYRDAEIACLKKLIEIVESK